MAIQFQRLAMPGDGVSTLLEFAPLAGAIGAYQTARKSQMIGDAAARGGNMAAAQEALKQGELDTGAQYQRLANQDQDRKTQNDDILRKRVGSLAQGVLRMGQTDPARADQVWRSGVARLGLDMSQMGPEDLDWKTGAAEAAAAAGMYDDPRESQLMDLKIAQANRDLSGTTQTRVGLQPVYGRDADGNIVVLQPSSSGEMIPARVPAGVTIDPGLVAGEKAARTAQGKWEGGAEQRNVGKERLSGQLKQMVGSYLKLDERGGIVNPDKGGLANLQARLGSSEAGQTIAGSVGTETQSIRRQITNLQPLLLQGIMQASGMGARAMDSNKELQFYLQAASDPTSGDIYSNLVAIDVLDKTYGLGNVLADSLPPEVLARVQQDSARAIEQRPISSQAAPQQPAQQQQGQPPVPGARQSPNDGNWYIPDANRPGKYLRVE